MIKTKFTRHAFFRSEERLHLTLEQVEELLDNDKTVLVGMNKGTDLMHRLFFSTVDKQCFVAIQDGKNGFVLTLLPLEYYRTRISLEATEKAFKLACGIANKTSVRIAKTPPSEGPLLKTSDKPINLNNFLQKRISFIFFLRNKLTMKGRIKHLKFDRSGYLSASEPDTKLPLERNSALVKILRDFVVKEIAENEYFENAIVAFNKSGPWDNFDLGEWNPDFDK